MNTRKLLLPAIVFAFALLALVTGSGRPVSAQEQESSASLEETMSWMKSKLSGMVTLMAFTESPPDAGPQWQQNGWIEVTYSKVEFTGCELTFTETRRWQVNGGAANGTLRTGQPDKQTINFSKEDPLGIRPKSYKHQTSEGWSLEMTKPVWTIEFPKQYRRIFFDDQELAKRFSRAASHAVKLCGGKVEPF